MAAPDFPFRRGVDVELGQLRQFFLDLSAYRQTDQAFSQRLRENQPPWKAWNEELVPLMQLADGLRLPDSDRFRLMPEGDSLDAELVHDGQRRGVQITIADPAWSNVPFTPGHLHALKTEHLAGGHVWGGARVRREGGRVVSEPHARDLEDDIEACKAGLIAAIARKSPHDGRGTTLLILAREFTHLLLDVDSAALVAEADLPPPRQDRGRWEEETYGLRELDGELPWPGRRKRK